MICMELNLRLSYYQVRMYIANIEKTTFRIRHGYYEFKMMPFGLKNSPATFQTLMNNVLEQFLRNSYWFSLMIS